MIVTMAWHGGSSYAVFNTNNHEDMERFPSLKSAKNAFWRRADFDPHYPCVHDSIPDHGGPEAWIFYGEPEKNIGRSYPDLVLSFGPRGGIAVSRG